MKIYCAKCGREVENTITRYFPEIRATVITVFCHGKTETMTLGDLDSHLLVSEEGVAFVEPKLDGPGTLAINGN